MQDLKMTFDTNLQGVKMQYMICRQAHLLCRSRVALATTYNKLCAIFTEGSMACDTD